MPAPRQPSKRTAAPRWRTRLLRIARRGAIVMAILLSLVGISWWRSSGGTPVRTAGVASPVVREVTGLYPIAVGAIATPTTTEAVAEAVRRSTGPITIGGGRYSMGGQTATPGGLQLDLRQL